MSISFRCDGCGKAYKTSEQWAGRTVHCKQCGKDLLISKAPAPSAPDVDLYGLDEEVPAFPPLTSNPYAPPQAPLSPPEKADDREDDAEPDNPWRSIWTRPRATIRYLVKNDPDRNVLLLAVLGGIVNSVGRASQRSMGDTIPLGGVLIACLIGGTLGGPITLYIGAALLGWTGRKLGGRADARKVRTAMAWSSVPLVVSGLIYVPMILLFGKELFTSETPKLDANPVMAMMVMAFVAVQVLLAIWSFVLFLKCLGEVHRFSAWRALGASVLAFLVILVPILPRLAAIAMS
ncbi:MAG: Yip1 family protein [Singulisphaera sp.]